MAGLAEPPGDARGADDRPVGGKKRDLVGDVPDGLPIGLADHFDPVHDPLAGEHLFVVQTKLIGQERRRQVVVGLADDVFHACVGLALLAIHLVVEQKCPVDPAIAAVAILDPYQRIFHAVEKLGHGQERLVFCDHGVGTCIGKRAHEGLRSITSVMAPRRSGKREERSRLPRCGLPTISQKC